MVYLSTETVTHPSRNYVIATRPGVELMTFRSYRVQRPNRYAAIASHLELTSSLSVATYAPNHFFSFFRQETEQESE